MAHRPTSWKSSQRNAGSACLGTRRLPRLPPILPSRTRISTRRSPSTRVQGHRCVSIKRMSTQICIALIDMSPRLLGFPAQGHDGSAPPPLTPLPHAPRSGLKKKEKQGLKRELFLQRAQPCYSILPPGGGAPLPLSPITRIRIRMRIPRRRLCPLYPHLTNNSPLHTGLEASRSPYSKSHIRRLKRLEREQIAGGLDGLRSALAAVEQDVARADPRAQAPVAPGAKNADAEPDRPQPRARPGQIGEGKGAPLKRTQRKRALCVPNPLLGRRRSSRG